MAVYQTIPTTSAAEDDALLDAPKTKKPLLRLAGAALVVAFALGATVAYVVPSKSGVPSAAAVAAFKSNSRQCVSIANGINDKQCPTNCDQVTKCDWCDTLYKVKGNVEGTIECGGSGPRDRFLDVECIGRDVCQGVNLRVPDFDLKMDCSNYGCRDGVVSTGGDMNLNCFQVACHSTDFTSAGPLVATCFSSAACREATFSSETSIDLTCDNGNGACRDVTLRAPRVTLTCGSGNNVCEGIRIPNDATICTCTGTGCPPGCREKESRVPMMALDAVSPAGADAATAVAKSAKSNTGQCVSIGDNYADQWCAEVQCDPAYSEQCAFCDTLYQVNNVDGTIECGGSGPRDRFLDVECLGREVCRGINLQVPDFDLKMICRSSNADGTTVTACGEGVVSTGGDMNLDCQHVGCRSTDFTSKGPLVATCSGSQGCRLAKFSSETSIDITCDRGNGACREATLRAPRITLTCGSGDNVCEGIRIPNDATTCTCTGTGCPPGCPAEE